MKKYLIILGIILHMIMLFIPCASNGDYECFIQPWINHIKTCGCLKSFSEDFYNYTPSYIYLLAIIAKLGIPSLIGVRLISGIFDYLCAWMVGLIGKELGEKQSMSRAFAIIPLLPTVLINSMYWGQCDSIYCTFAIASTLFLLKGKSLYAVSLLGIAFSIKLQTIFLFPFFFAMLLKGRIIWWHLLLIPIIYCITIIPAYAAGRPLWSLLTIYASQSSLYNDLTLQFPNIYSVFPIIEPSKVTIIKYCGIATCALLSLAYVIHISHIDIKNEHIPILAMIMVVCICFILPCMHERYMYMGDILAVICAITNSKYVRFAIGVVSISLYGYLQCTRLGSIIPLWPGIIIYLLVIVGIIRTIKSGYEEREKN